MKASTQTIPLFTDVGLLIKMRLQAALPMPFAQCQALSFIADNTEPNMQDVARYFKITAPSATFLVDELVRGGYVVRRANTTDRRKIELLLTPKGKQAFKTVTQKRTRVLESVFKPLHEKDRTELNRILGKILASA